MDTTVTSSCSSNEDASIELLIMKINTNELKSREGECVGSVYLENSCK